MYDNIPEQLRPKQTFAGQLDPAFLYADKVYRHAPILDGLKCFKGLAISEADRHRLVEDSKSPTANLLADKLATAEWEARSKTLQACHAHNRSFIDDEHEIALKEKKRFHYGDTYSEYEPQRMETPLETAGTKMVVEKRDWSNEFRVRTQVESAGAPPVQEGERETTMLSYSGARKIAESCAYVATERTGFCTFVTMTLRPEARAAMEQSASGNYCLLEDRPTYRKGNKPAALTPIADHCRISDRDKPEHHGGRAARETSPVGRYSRLTDKPDDWVSWSELPTYSPSEINDKALRVSIQKELSRCMDNWQKIYQRGIPAEGIPSNNDNLDYIWVVEVPENEHGEKNPHVHILMRWEVEYKHFKAWSARLEKAWGQGFAHIEKIKDPMAAGAYMAKAADYLTKGSSNDDQGVVIGNRYGISESARAPDWETMTEGQLHIMGQLIADVYDHLTVLHGRDFAERKKLNDLRTNLLSDAKRIQAEDPKSRYPLLAKVEREKIGEQLKGVRDRIAATPVRANKYQLVFKGIENLNRFINWAKSDSARSHSDSELLPDWLPEKPAGCGYIEGRKPEHIDNHYIYKLHSTGRKMREWRFERIKSLGAATEQACVDLVDKVRDFRDWAFSGWGEYEALDLCQ